MDAETISEYQRKSSNFGGKFAIINLKVLANNFDQIQSLSPSDRFCACIKSNAYGHGLLEAAKALEKSDYFSVCDLNEAYQLHQAGFKNIVLYNLLADLSIWEKVCDFKFIGVVYHFDQFLNLLKLKRPIRIWLKLNTGMNRLGFSVEQVFKVIEALHHYPHVEVDAVMTHFACADQIEHPLNQKQLAIFKLFSDQFDYPVSLSASFALINDLYLGRQIIRPGISLYGACKHPKNLELNPVMQLWATVIQVFEISKGESAGYGAHWKATKKSKIAIVNFGYADGFPYLKNPKKLFVYVQGKKVEVVGSVSMNSFQINVSDILSIQVGDLVMIWGKKEVLLDFSEASRRISYDLLSGVNQERVLFHYVE